jgi:hypothetical protein
MFSIAKIKRYFFSIASSEGDISASIPHFPGKSNKNRGSLEKIKHPGCGKQPGAGFILPGR